MNFYNKYGAQLLAKYKTVLTEGEERQDTVSRLPQQTLLHNTTVLQWVLAVGPYYNYSSSCRCSSVRLGHVAISNKLVLDCDGTAPICPTGSRVLSPDNWLRKRHRCQVHLISNDLTDSMRSISGTPLCYT